MAVDALIGSLVEPFEFILLGLYLGINNYRTLLTGCKLVLFALGRRRKKKKKVLVFYPSSRTLLTSCISLSSLPYIILYFFKITSLL